MKIKLLIIIMLLFACSVANGQTKNDMLDKIDFNDTTLVGSEELINDVLCYIGACQDTTKPAQNQIYDVILAVDNVMTRCTSYQMYRFVYQNLISDFSALGVNALVDYLVHLPYLEFLDIGENEKDEMRKIAESYCRVQIGSKAPDIMALTVNGESFELYSLKSEYTVLLFWSANCPHCREMIKEFGKYLIEKQNVAFVSICVVGKKRVAEKIIRRAKITNGIMICDDNEWNSKIVDDYAVDMTPMIFVLDESKTILSKPFDVGDVKKIIK